MTKFQKRSCGAETLVCICCPEHPRRAAHTNTSFLTAILCLSKRFFALLHCVCAQPLTWELIHNCIDHLHDHRQTKTQHYFLQLLLIFTPTHWQVSKTNTAQSSVDWNPLLIQPKMRPSKVLPISCSFTCFECNMCLCWICIPTLLSTLDWSRHNCAWSWNHELWSHGHMLKWSSAWVNTRCQVEWTLYTGVPVVMKLFGTKHSRKVVLCSLWLPPPRACPITDCCAILLISEDLIFVFWTRRRSGRRGK